VKRPERPEDRMPQLALTSVFARNVRKMRADCEVSAEALAARATRLGIPMARSLITNIETGRRQQIGLDEADAIARALNVTLESLLREEEP
jgi:transcriptional regulator with XRE-family HTH domain